MTAGALATPGAVFGAAALVALSGAMAPGPFLTLTITRTVRHGSRSALLMLVGHAALEAALIAAFALGLQAVLARAVVVRGLALVGGLFLLWMGAGLLKGAATGAIAADLEAAERTAPLGPVSEGAVASLSNPYWLLWWVTIGAAMLTQALAIGPLGVAAFYVGHQLGDVAWYAFVITAVAKGRHLLPPLAYRLVMAGLALFLVALGARFGLVGAGLIAMS